jgi:23S rRNA pseudouridine1911/1915/1917 synthase
MEKRISETTPDPVRLEILYEDNHLLVVNKRPGMATQGAAAGRPSLPEFARSYLRRKYRKPGNVYLGVVSRLDSDTSGVVVFARTSKAAARLTAQFRERSVEKEYWALVEGKMKTPSGQCVDWIVKDEQQRRMLVASENHPAALKARLQYRTLKVFADTTLLEINLETGRKHQIRVQLAARGHPIVGDRKYGSRQRFSDGIALHCRKLIVEHPVKKTPIEFVASIPAAWKILGV